MARRRAEAKGDPGLVKVTPAVVADMLGAPKFMDEEMEERTKDPGVAIGLAWTPTGGEVLFIEASRMAGTGSLTLTGQLGDVMKESAQAALSLLKARAQKLGIELPEDDGESDGGRPRGRRAAEARGDLEALG